MRGGTGQRIIFQRARPQNFSTSPSSSKNEGTPGAVTQETCQKNPIGKQNRRVREVKSPGCGGWGKLFYRTPIYKSLNSISLIIFCSVNIRTKAKWLNGKPASCETKGGWFETNCVLFICTDLSTFLSGVSSPRDQNTPKLDECLKR